jgi:selenocysteine lyase/cysteine desulfurase
MSARITPAYFNYAGLARPARSVARRVRAVEREYAHLLFSEDGIRMYEAVLAECRLAANALLGAGGTGDVTLLPNSSTALNLAISVFGATLEPGAMVLTSDQEHPAVEWPLGRLAARGIEIERVASTSPAEFLERIEALTTTRRPALAVFSHVSYKTGRVLPVEDAGRIFAQHAVPYIVDGAQALGQLPVDVRATRVCAYAFTGHKWLFGPMGTGGLWTSSEFVRDNPLAWAGNARRGGAVLENGTINCALFAGLAEACRACAEEFPSRVEKMSQIAAEITRRLEGTYCEAAGRWDGPHAPGILAYALNDSISGAEMAEAAMLRYQVAIKPFRPTFEPNGFRISFSPWTTAREIDSLIVAMRALFAESRKHTA